MSKCPVNCEERPDAVDKINWKCVNCGKDLKNAFELKKSKAEEFYKNQAEIIKQAERKAKEAYDKVFRDEIKVIES